MRLYDRSVSVAIGRRGEAALRQWRGLAVRVKVKRTLRRTPDSAEITLYNLSDDSVALLDRTDLVVVVTAGYGGDEGLVYTGDVEDVEDGRELPDRVTTLTCGDGEAAYNRAHASVSITPGSEMRSAVRSIAETLRSVGINVDLAAIDRLPRIAAPRGYSFDGRARDGLDEIAQRHGCTWTIQNGRLVFVQQDADAGTPAVLLTPATGLLGTPTRTKKSAATRRSTTQQWEVRAQFQAGLVPGAVVRVESSSWTGFGVVGDCEVELDSHGDAFDVSMTVTAR